MISDYYFSYTCVPNKVIREETGTCYCVTGRHRSPLGALGGLLQCTAGKCTKCFSDQEMERHGCEQKDLRPTQERLPASVDNLC